MESNKSSPHNTRIPKVIWLPGEVPILNHFIFHSQHVNFMFLSMWSACVVIFVCLKYWNHLRPKCMRDFPPPLPYYMAPSLLSRGNKNERNEIVANGGGSSSSNYFTYHGCNTVMRCLWLNARISFLSINRLQSDSYFYTTYCFMNILFIFSFHLCHNTIIKQCAVHSCGP